jgi:hypothetical protein
VILPAVHANYYQLPPILRFELPQLREYMDAVDSTIGPEIEKHDFSSKVRELEFSASRMDPVEIVRKLRGTHCWCWCELSWH